jgi:hypothetical protein
VTFSSTPGWEASTIERLEVDAIELDTPVALCESHTYQRSSANSDVEIIESQSNRAGPEHPEKACMGRGQLYLRRRAGKYSRVTR